ncbi:MAG: phenylacetate-CoA oxygenase subunit PaaC [Ignavibacteriales bacterium]|nr:phenylacetate-CoA oxygenase subunit PaaC [Ignavibacteriales bacterium]
MGIELPAGVTAEALSEFLLALADDELVLGHRDSEWTAYAPILEEDIAFSNIAQDELGHSLVWFSLCEKLTGKNPDEMAFQRPWEDFRCCRFVAYPKGDFAYTVVRQFLFDVAEQVRLIAISSSSFGPLREISQRIIREENYHVMHSQGLIERLGDATEESRRRMQSAVDVAFPQSLGIFEHLKAEEELVDAGFFPGNDALKSAWLAQVVPVLRKATLTVPVHDHKNTFAADGQSDDGGRQGKHTVHLQALVADLQSVYKLVPNAKW